MKNLSNVRTLFRVILIVSIFNPSTINGARILGVFPYPAKSHFIFNSAVLKSLLDAGHEVTVITSFPRDIAGENYTAVIDTSNEFRIQVANTTYNGFRKWSSYSILPVGFGDEKPLCEKVWNRKEIQNMMNSKEKLFDVIFVEVFFLYKCLVPVAHKMKIPVIGTMTYKSWIPADLAANNPNHPAYIPYEISVNFDQDKFFSRLLNTWDHLMVYYFWYSVVIPFAKRFYSDNFQQLVSYSDYINMEPSAIFYNSHYSYLNRPMNPNVIEIGGIHLKPAKKLPKDYEKFIEDAPHGVILFTFGSLVKTSSMPNETIKLFLNVFAQIPQRVIMKYDTSLEDGPDNVMIADWVPQRDILEHKNVIAFISHCGQAGIYEAIHTATPIIALPLMYDQTSNAMCLERLGVAVNLDLDYLTEDEFLRALDSIVNNTRYRENMRKLSFAFKDRPMTPQQSVVYWTEYVIRHNGASHLKSASSELNWLQYFLIDVIICVLLFVIIAAYFLYSIFKFFYRAIVNSESSEYQKKKNL